MTVQRKRKPSLVTLESYFIIVFGFCLRIRQYGANRSLWLDEAMLALNIVNRSFVGLTELLDYDQGAPIGFLFLEKLMIVIFGNKDYVLRFYPFVAGIIALPLMYYVTKCYIGSRGIHVAVGLFAVTSTLIYYASEAKQYSSDVMVSLLLLLVAYKCIGENASSKHFLALGFVSAISLLLSHPALFILVGIGLSLTVDTFIKKNKSRYIWLGSLCFVWLTSFAILYLVSLRFLAANENLTDYWRFGFMPMPPWRNISWFRKIFQAMLDSPIGLTNTLISTALFLLGCSSIFYRNWKSAIVLTVPFLATLVASGLEKYPFNGRLLLFAIPMIILLVVEGIERTYLVLRKFNSSLAIGVWIILGILMLYSPVKTALQNFHTPEMGEHIKPVMAYLQENKLDTDSIYVYYGARYAFQYYAPSYNLEHSRHIAGVYSRDKPETYIDDLDKLNGRFWFLFSHNCSWCEVNEEVYYLDHLNETSVKIDEFISSDAAVYLYDFGPQEP